MGNWYYANGEKPIGPLSLNDLMNILSHHEDARNLLVWRPGFAQWQLAGDVTELAAGILRPPPVPQSRQLSSQPARQTAEGARPTLGSYLHTALVEKYADFDGRASRSEFWTFFFFALILQVIASLISALGGFAIVFSFAIGVYLLCPSLAVGCRRLHDIDQSGWYQLLHIIPVVGGIILIVLWCLPGTVSENQYGPDPSLQPATRDEATTNTMIPQPIEPRTITDLSETLSGDAMAVLQRASDKGYNVSFSPDKSSVNIADSSGWRTSFSSEVEIIKFGRDLR